MEAQKKKVGLFLPVALADALDDVASRVGKKQKWLVVGAALIRLLESPEEEQNDLIRRVKIADLPGGSFDSLIRRAKSHATGGPGFQDLVAVDDEDSAQPRKLPRGTARSKPAKSSSKRPR